MRTRHAIVTFLSICAFNAYFMQQAASDEGSKVLTPRKEHHKHTDFKDDTVKEPSPFVVVIPRSTAQPTDTQVASEPQPVREHMRERRHSAAPKLSPVPPQDDSDLAQPQPQSHAREHRLANKHLSFVVDDDQDDKSEKPGSAPTHLVLEVSDKSPSRVSTPIPLDLSDLKSGRSQHDSSIVIQIPDEVIDELVEADPSDVEHMITELLKETFGMTDDTEFHISGLREILSEEVSNVIKEHKIKQDSSSSGSNGNSSTSSSSDSSSDGNRLAKLPRTKDWQPTPHKQMTAALRHAVLQRVQSRSSMNGLPYRITGDDHRDLRAWMFAELDSRDKRLHEELQRINTEHEQTASKLASERRKKIIALITAGITAGGTVATALITFFATRAAR